nr:PEP-CTERM sorting domain-containing protein [Duganella sp. HH101]
MKKILTLLALLSACMHVSATEYITNGTFDEPGYYYTVSQRGWETTAPRYYFAYNTYWLMGGGGTLSQHISGATGLLHLSFDWTSSRGSQSVVWNGVTIATLFDGDPWTPNPRFEFDVRGTGNDKFEFLADNPESFAWIREVSLTSAVPEPEAYAMLLGGLGLLGLMRRRRPRASKSSTLK